MSGWVAGATIGAAVIGAGASAYGAKKSASATKHAAQLASDTELQMYNQSRTDLGPYREAGYGALDMLTQLYGVTPRSVTPTSSGSAGTGTWSRIAAGIVADKLDPRAAMAQGGAPAPAPAAGGQPPARDLTNFYKSPDYDFRMREGLAGIGNSYAARGGALSGPSARAAGRFSADVASGSFNDYVNRLASIAGIGQTATNTTAGLGANTAGNLSNIYTQAGAQRASTYGQMASGVNSAIQGGLQNWSFNNYLNRGGGGGGGSAPASGPLNLGPVWQPYQYRP